MSLTQSSQRVSLTKSQLATPIGNEFLNLLSDIGKDGVLEYEELERLTEFLNNNHECGIPGVKYLFDLMIRVCEDQELTSEEFLEIQLGIEKVLPPAIRTEITRSRLALLPEAFPDPATERQLDYIRILGRTPPEGLTKIAASELISQLKQNPPASPRQIMFLRFWGRVDLIKLSRDEISAWMTDFIDEDERRRNAWNRYKRDIGDDGTQRNPEIIPIGIGSKYL
jgi:hypothetical protein